MSGIETLNLLFRFATVGLQVLIILRMITDLTFKPFKWLFIGLSICGIGYVVASSGTLFARHPITVLWFVPLTFPIGWLFWTSALALFEDGFSIRPFHWAVLGTVLVLSSAEFYFSIQIMGPAGGLFPLINDIMNLTMVSHALYVAWHGREADLLEGRRSFRLLFVGAVGLLIGVIVSFELSFAILGYEEASGELLLLAAVAIWAIVLLLTLQLLSLRPDSLLVELAAPAPASERVAIDPADQALYQKLQRAMETDEAYRTEGLTIGALAETLGTPEHQLRKLINQSMGFKNFNAYLNTYRLAVAKADLSNLELARKQVLTIALDAGYASLGPFNRAFKEETGQTPTEFRKQALAAAAKQKEQNT